MTNHQLMESVAIELFGKGLAGAIMEAYDVCFESSGNGKNYEDLRKVALRLLGEANAFNVMHWNADTNLKHVLLQSAYDICRSTGDKLAETYMSITEKACEPAGDDDMASGNCDESTALARLKGIQSEMQGTVKRNGGYSEGVKNIFADFDEAITDIIYKFQQFKS